MHKTYSSLLTGLVLSVLNFQAMANFTTPKQTLQTAQGELHYHKQSASKPSQATVILLGGGPGFSSWNLEPIQTQIAAFGFDTYLMDMPGIGENQHYPDSQPTTTTITDSWVEVIHALQNASQSDRVILVGHSWGTLMAMLYTRAYPEKVQQLILINPVDPEKIAMRDLTENIHERNQQQANQDWDHDAAWDNEISLQSSAEQEKAITELQITQVLPTYFYDYQQGVTYSQQFTHKDFSVDLNVAAWKAYDENPIRYSDIAKWKLPIDFVECEQDPLMPQNLNAMQAQMHFRTIEILKQCGHFPWVEQPTAFQQTLKKLLID